MDIVESSFCSAATNLSAANVTSTSALLQWFVAGTDSVKLQVATDEEFADKSLIIDTVLVKAGGKFALGSLTPATTYYYRLQHLCSEEEIADWVAADFQTDYTIRFFENFSATRTYPENWNRASVSLFEYLLGREEDGRLLCYGDGYQLATRFRFADRFERYLCAYLDLFGCG